MVTLSSCLIWQIITFIFRRTNMYIRLKIAGKYCDRSTYRRCRQNCRIWSTDMLHAFIEKPTHPNRAHCLVQILGQRHNWAIFLWKWVKRGRYSQWRSLSGYIERIFVNKNWRGGYWQYLVSTGRRYVLHSRSYTRCFAPCFWRSRYQPQSWCRLATSELRFDTVGLLFVGCRQR